MSLAYERVLGHLERLKLKRVSELLDPISEQATKDSLSYVGLPRPALGSRSLEPGRAPPLGQDAIGSLSFHKTLADFDFGFQPSIDRKQIQELATLRFLAHGENVI